MAEEESFKVTDRRGRPKDPTTEAAAPPSAGPEPILLGPTGAEAVGTPGRGEPGMHEDLRPDAPLADLQGLFIMFASSALIGLGAAPDPATGQPHMDLEQAREAIDVLLLLREKTEGNRTEAETRVLEDILYDLQMRFVRVAKGR